MKAVVGDCSVLTVGNGNGNLYGIDSLKVSRLQFTPILKVLFKLLLSILNSSTLNENTIQCFEQFIP